MGLINITDIQTNDDATAELWNSRYATIVNAINGNIDAANLADGAVTTAKLGTSSVTTGKIADNAITSAKIVDAGITFPDLSTTIFGDQITSGTIGGTFGGTYNQINLGGMRIVWGTSQAQSIGAGGNPNLAVTFPTAFSVAPTVFATSNSLGSAPQQFLWAVSPSTTGFSVSFYNFGSGTGTIYCSWLAIGKA